MKIELAPIRPGYKNGLLKPLLAELAKAEHGDSLVRAGFAYVTLGGVQAILAKAVHTPEWELARKQILVSIHRTITEPAALQKLSDIPNSDVRAFVPGKKLRAEAVDAPPVFHPKVFAVSDVETGRIRFLQAGSANMTASAIGSVPKNYEFAIGVCASGGLPNQDANRFNRWWSGIWSQSRKIDSTFISKYATLREQIHRDNPILRSAVDVPSSISRAKFFFIEVGAGSGPPGQRHQVEFPEGLAKFFGRIQRKRKNIDLIHGSMRWSGRPLSYKRTTYEVEIWRLGMPTQNSGGAPIANRVIRFERTNKPNQFRFQVADADSRKFRGWIKDANRHGHLGATRGQRSRRYGFYD